MSSKTNYVKNGQAYYRVRVTIGKKPDGKPLVKEFYGNSRKDAEHKRDEYLEGIKKGLNTDFQSMTLGKLMKIWLFEVVRISSSYATFDRYESVYRNYVLKTELEQLIISSIRPLTLQVYYNKLADSGKTYSIIYNLNKVLKTFFNYVIAQGYILLNPCFKIVIPKTLTKDDEDDNNEVDPLTDDEIALIKKHVAKDFEMLFLLALGTGLRRGELLGLSFENVDIENKELHVNKALKMVKRIQKDGSYDYARILEPPKTKNSVRTVPIPTNLIMPLKAHIVNEKKKHLLYGAPFNQSDLFFTTDGLTPKDGKNVLTSWKRTLKRAGVRERSFHNIRHTYATKLFEQDVPLKTVSMLLGHSNIAITANTYTHVMPKQKIDAVDKLNYLF